MLAVGVRPRGHASLSTPTSMTMLLCFARVEFLLPVNVMIVHPILRILGIRILSSSVSPLLERAINISSWPTIPRSPCMASAGCKNRDLVPVLLRVATIFRPTIPDLPMPLMIKRPLELWMSSTILAKLSSMRSASFRIPSASILRTSTACFITMCIIFPVIWNYLLNSN